MLLFYLDAMEQAILKRQLQRPVSLSILAFPSRIEDSRSFDVNMVLSLSQRPFQEVTSGSSVPSSGPNGEGRAPEFIDYPHPPLKSHRSYKT